jgi:hypothetical protein
MRSGNSPTFPPANRVKGYFRFGNIRIISRGEAETFVSLMMPTMPRHASDAIPFLLYLRWDLFCGL